MGHCLRSSCYAGEDAGGSTDKGEEADVRDPVAAAAAGHAGRDSAPEGAEGLGLAET